MKTVTKVCFKVFGISFEIVSWFKGPDLIRSYDGCVNILDQYMISVKSDYYNWSFIYHDINTSDPIKVLCREKLIRVIVDRFYLAKACRNPSQRTFYSKEIVERGDRDFDNFALLVGGEPRWANSIFHEMRVM